MAVQLSTSPQTKLVHNHPVLPAHGATYMASLAQLRFNYILPAFLTACVFLYMTMEGGAIVAIFFGVLLVVLPLLAVVAHWLYRRYCKRSKTEDTRLLDGDTQPSGQSTIEQKVVNGNLCVIAADQHTLSTIAEQVRQATDGLYSVKEHLVTNRKAVADLPIYTRAICCALNAERNISFDREGNPEPDADLGFRAFDRMDAYTGKKSGVLLLLFDHYKSHDISELYSMAGFNPSQRLRDTAEDGRFLTVYRELNDKQIDRIKKIF